MSYDLNSIDYSRQKPARIVIYGVPGIGKTTLAANAPSPIFLPVEDGLGTLQVPAFPQPQSWSDVLSALNVLLNDDHPFQTVVLDSLDKLEPLIWDHVCKINKQDRIESFGYGKGYVHALTEWRTLLHRLDNLRDKGMTIVLLAHSTVVRFDAPDTEPYDRYQLRLHKAADAAVGDWADAILFANYKVVTVDAAGDKKRGIGRGERALHTTERPAYRAKNRYQMSDSIPMTWSDVERFIVPPVAPATVEEQDDGAMSPGDDILHKHHGDGLDVHDEDSLSNL